MKSNGLEDRRLSRRSFMGWVALSAAGFVGGCGASPARRTAGRPRVTRLTLNLYPHPLASKIKAICMNGGGEEVGRATAALAGDGSPQSFALEGLTEGATYLIEIKSMDKNGKALELNFIRARIREKGSVTVYPLSGLWGFEGGLKFEDGSAYDALSIKPVSSAGYGKTHEAFIIAGDKGVPFGTLNFVSYDSMPLLYGMPKEKERSILPGSVGVAAKRKVIGLDGKTWTSASGLLQPVVLPREAEKLLYPCCLFSGVNEVSLKILQVSTIEKKTVNVKDEAGAVTKAIEALKNEAHPGIIEKQDGRTAVRDATIIIPFRECTRNSGPFCLAWDPKELKLRTEKADIYVYEAKLKRKDISGHGEGK